MTLADLAAEIASRERDEPDETGREEYVKRVQISLYHSHIPQLEEIGVVDFDADDKTVSLDDGALSRSIKNRLVQANSS